MDDWSDGRRQRPVKDGGASAALPDSWSTSVLPDIPADATPTITNTRKKVSSTVKPFAKSMASGSGPGQLAPSTLTFNNSFKKGEGRTGTETEAQTEAEASPLSVDTFEDGVKDDDSSCSGSYEDRLQDPATGPIETSIASYLDSRLSAVTEASRESSDSELASGCSDDYVGPWDEVNDYDDDDDYNDHANNKNNNDDGEEVSIRTGKAESKKGPSSRARKFASKMGKAAVKMAKAPLKIKKRLASSRDDVNTQEQEQPTTSLQQSPASSRNAAAHCVVNGMELHSPTKTDEDTSVTSPDNRRVSLSIDELSLPLRFLNERPRTFRSSILSEQNSSGTLHSGSSSLSAQSYRSYLLSASTGSAEASMTSFDSLPSPHQFSKRGSLLSSLGSSLPTLASISANDSLVDMWSLESPFIAQSRRVSNVSTLRTVPSLPTLASISANDSVVDMESMSFSMDSSTRSEISTLPGGASTRASVTSIPPLDPAILDVSERSVDTLESVDYVAKMRRPLYYLGFPLVDESMAGTLLDEISPALDVGLRSKEPNKQQQRWASEMLLVSPEIPVYSSRYSRQDTSVDNNHTLLDSAPSVATRRISVQIEKPSLFDNSTNNTSVGNHQTLLDSAPRVATRRSSVEMPLLSDNSTNNTSVDNHHTLLDSAPRVATRRSSVEMPLLSDNSTNNTSVDNHQTLLDSAPRVATRRSSVETPLLSDNSTNNTSVDNHQTLLDSAPRVATRRSSVEIPSLSDMEELSLLLKSRTDTIPIWAPGGFDRAPTMARRRPSRQNYAQPHASGDKFAEAETNTPAIVSMADPKKVPAIRESSQKDSKPRTASRRPSSQIVFPLPTLLEDDNACYNSSAMSIAAAAAEVAESFHDDL